jgi:hypothetical protein
LAIVLTLAVGHSVTAVQELQAGQDLQAGEAQPELAPEWPDAGRADGSRKFARDAGRLEGVWEAQVTRRNCATGEPIGTFRGMTNFIAGGALIGTNSNPNPPTTYGRWYYLGARRYIAFERLFRYSPDGSFAGVQRITRNITLARDGYHFTGTNTSQVVDVEGNLIASGCTTDVTRRVE